MYGIETWILKRVYYNWYSICSGTYTHMHTFSNGFIYSFLCSRQPFAETASHHSYHMLSLFVLGFVCFLMPAQISGRTHKSVQKRQIHVDYEQWIASPYICCLALLWFATFSKPQVFFSSVWRGKTGNIFPKLIIFSSIFPHFFQTAFLLWAVICLVWKSSAEAAEKWR